MIKSLVIFLTSFISILRTDVIVYESYFTSLFLCSIYRSMLKL